MFAQVIIARIHELEAQLIGDVESHNAMVKMQFFGGKYCPTCGWPTKTIFDHVDIECNSDMSRDEVTALVQEAQS